MRGLDPAGHGIPPHLLSYREIQTHPAARGQGRDQRDRIIKLFRHGWGHGFPFTRPVWSVVWFPEWFKSCASAFSLNVRFEQTAAHPEDT
jgi:hypothetical protein